MDGMIPLPGLWWNARDTRGPTSADSTHWNSAVVPPAMTWWKHGGRPRAVSIALEVRAMRKARRQGLTPVHLSAPRKRFWWDKGYLGGV
jgi:hypothetical protein